jgi:hypothetical protein
MLIALLAAGLAAFAQGASTQIAVARGDSPVRASSSRVDSLRALRAAHRAQESFESIRHQYLPHEYGVGSHHCDVQIGRWCVWNDDSNDRRPPPEAPRTIEARAKLLALLDSVSSRIPGDEWIAAQRVRYLVEATRYVDAVRAAERCSDAGSPYRCRAYAGVALHDSGAVAAADSAFQAALAAMPDSVRCQWTDISLLIDDDIADRYRRADCAARRDIEASFWSLTTPLYLRDHDYRNEFLARVTRTDMARNSRTAMGSPTESAFRETALRYGYDTWFVRGDPPAGSMSEAPVAGYREGGSGFNFVPDYRVFLSPDSLSIDDWELKLHSARTIYAPAYARHFQSLPRRQIALFRRGDSALVVAAYDVSDDTLFARAPIEAGLFTAPIDSTHVGEARGSVEHVAPPRGVLTTTAPWHPMVVSVELLDSASRSAARTRYSIAPPATLGRIGISDLLIFTPTSPDTQLQALDAVLPLAVHDDHVSASRPVGVFFETYGARPEGETFDVALQIDRVKEGWRRRAAERLHLASPFSPVKVQWRETPNGEIRIPSRAMTLDLSRLEPGRYEIRLTLTAKDELAAVATREIVVTR